MSTDLTPSNGGLPSDTEWKILKEQAEILVKTKFLPPSIQTPEQAIAIALKGRELGIPIMQSFSHINIINGRPSISAELMLALIYKNCPRAKINFDENGNTACTISASRPGDKPTKFSFTIEDAKKAGLVRAGGPWEKYPAALLRARTITVMARALFPDAISGCSYTSEELGGPVDNDIIEMEI